MYTLDWYGLPCLVIAMSYTYIYRIPLLSIELDTLAVFEIDGFLCLSTWKHFQILSVSSAAALATVVPSGDIVRPRIREVCPVSSVTLTRDGYFQIVSWLLEKPCPDISSLYSLDHKIAHT